MREYNKLVRDKIPGLIQAAGRKVNYRVLGPEEYEDALRLKIVEEAVEVRYAITEEKLIEELADLITAYETFITVHGLKPRKIRKAAKAKAKARGKFTKRYFLTTAEG